MSLATTAKRSPRLTEPLASHHDRADFTSGADALDRYLKTQAGQDARKHVAAPFVLVGADGRIVGYYTLSATAVPTGDFPAETTRKLPRYPLIPATLLGRLAVDRRRRGQGHGRFLLADALHRAFRSEVASFAVIVDAKDDDARRFYAREGFLAFPDSPMRLFRPMADIAGLFQAKGLAKEIKNDR